MIPWWKVKRESIRAREQIAAWLGNLYEPALKRRHDLWRAAQPVPLDCGVALTGKVAIFLLYQPKGVAPSILATLRWLVANGYAPLVVSNTPLSDSDRSDVAKLSWRIFERPNFGYDFGGYRDGVLLLDAWGIKPERLLIVNDSVWMPTRADSTLIQRLEAVQADVVGGTMHPDRDKGLAGMRPSFVDSYLLLVNQSAIAASAFKRFWKNYPASSRKINAVNRGERKFSPRMRAAGLRTSGLFNKIDFVEKIAQMDEHFIRKTLKYGAYVDDAFGFESTRLLDGPSSATWRTEAVDHIKRTVDRRRFNAAFPYAADMLFGIDFIKKAGGSVGLGRMPVYRAMRCQLLKAVAAGDVPEILPEVTTEMKNLESSLSAASGARSIIENVL